MELKNTEQNEVGRNVRAVARAGRALAIRAEDGDWRSVFRLASFALNLASVELSRRSIGE